MTQLDANRAGCLIFFSAIFVVYHIFYAYHVLLQATQLEIISVYYSMMQSGIAILWSLVLITLVTGLVRKNRYALRYSKWIWIAFIAYQVIRVVILSRADYDRQRLPFAILLMIIIMMIPLLFRSQQPEGF